MSTKVLDEDGVVLLATDIKVLSDATYPANAAIASTYDSTASYEKRDYCLRNGLLYKCNTPIGSGGEAWNSSHWDQTSAANELGTGVVKMTSVTLTAANWSGSDPYSQTVSVSGGTINSKVDFQPTAAQLAQLISDGVASLLIENNSGTFTAYAVGAATSTNMTIQATITEVTT